jgi:hypothetical protein
MYTRPSADNLMLQDPYASLSPGRSYNWWLRLTSVAPQVNQFDLNGRERARRSVLASWLILGLFVADLVLIPLAIGYIGTVIAVGSVFVGLVCAALFNRHGWVTTAGILLVALITAAIFGSIATEPTGLGMFDLPGYDLLAMTVIVGASILPPVSAFFIAGINCVLIVVDFILQPHATDLIANIQINGAVALVARPIALLIIVAVVAYLWVRGTREQILRADRAEEMAALEHAYALQRQQLEIGVQQILATHVRIANGDYSARAPLSQDNALWQIASSLNNLVSRFRTIAEQTNRVGYQLQRTEEEIHRLAIALRDLQAGRRPIWPAPSRTAVDELLPILAGRDRKPATLPPPPSWDPGTGGGQPGQSGVQQQRFSESSYGWPSPASPAAPTPPPISGGGWTHNPPRFGPPLTDAPPRQPISTPRPDPTGSTGQMPPIPTPPTSPFPAYQTPSSSPRTFEEGWPSLDASAMGSTDWGTGELNGDNSSGAAPGEDAAFPPLDNPWYLPPDE